MARFVNYLDENAVQVLNVPVEPWGLYDSLASAFAVLLLFSSTVGIIAFFLNPALSLLLGFIFFALGATLFSLTFQHRSEASKYRSHLQHVESMLGTRTEALILNAQELQAMKRSLRSVRDRLIADTEKELREKRLRIEEQLEIAFDQKNAVHRMADRYLTETQKWWTSKLTSDNYSLNKERITKAIDFCRKQGYEVKPQLEREILDRFNQEFEIVLARDRERAEQMKLREQMRDEQRAKREIQREIERTQREARRRESEEEAIKRALEEALKKAGTEHSAEVEKLKNELKLAEQRAIEAQMAAQRTISQAQLTKVGNVYVISNIGSFGENGYKIGLTRRLQPLDRILELGDASVPFPFDVHLMIRSDDAPALERKLHKALNRYRINRVNFRKEFFRVDLNTIRRLVETYHGKIEYEYPGVTEESEYRKSINMSEAEFEARLRSLNPDEYEDDDDDLDGMDQSVWVDDDTTI